MDASSFNALLPLFTGKQKHFPIKIQRKNNYIISYLDVHTMIYVGIGFILTFIRLIIEILILFCKIKDNVFFYHFHVCIYNVVVIQIFDYLFFGCLHACCNFSN